jgi:hypothetical protein
MFNVWEGKQIPYRELSENLFLLPAWREKQTEAQRFIPFLGAGVSLSARTNQISTPRQEPDLQRIETCCASLGLQGASTQLFIRMAVYLALCMEAAEKTSPNLDEDRLLDDLQKEAFPPSARELARLFSNLSTYTAFTQVADTLKNAFPEGFINAPESQQIHMLKLLARVTDIADPPDPLTSITSYYENKNGRTSLWTKLRSVISYKKEPTLTHRLLAAAAKRHVEQPDVWQDYLILTTNYDCLMEDALDEARVDYAVLATRKRDNKVLVRFSDGVKDAARFKALNSEIYYPDRLVLQKPKFMVVICKIHGCLNPNLSDKDDGVVISDNDYVNYISQMNSSQGTIPSHVNTLMQDKLFLFLGYSLNDWNVRSVFETIRKKRGELLNDTDQDYAVMKYLGDYERPFFQRNDVAILKTDLNTFATGLVEDLERMRNNDSDWAPLVDKILSAPRLTATPEIGRN